MYVLQTNGLSKYYGNIRALDNLHLEVRKGDVLGLLGPNGSGKTTTLSLILGIVRPNIGSYRWFEGAYENPILKIGSILETPNHYTYLSGWENLQIVAHIKRVNENELMQLAELVGLEDRIHSTVKTYSLGMRQRLAIACSMVGDPELLIFDEPTNGLDPQGIAEVRGLINRIADTGKTIILASHILSEVEKICSHTAILNRGRLIASGRVSELLKQTNSYTVASPDTAALQRVLPGFGGYLSHTQKEDGVTVELKDDFDGAALNSYCHKNGLTLSHLAYEEKRLEDAFMEMLSKDQNQ